MNSDSSSEPQLPIQHLYGLARLWAGKGDLIDWLGTDADLIEVRWPREVVRARVSAAVLNQLQSKWLRYLPRSPNEWLDALSQQISRSANRLDYPTAHTDWLATISEFGRYPARTYIERKPVGSYDTAYSRVLKAVSRLLLRANDLAAAQLGSQPLAALARANFESTLKLPAISVAADQDVSQDDLAVCRSTGGIWLIAARLADELISIWSADAAAQIRNLVPILPQQFRDRLFELSTLGAIVAHLSSGLSGSWHSSSPIGAAAKGQPCLGWRSKSAAVDFFYQTVPLAARSKDTPYARTAKPIGGILRPDMWIEVHSSGTRTQIVIECKFSLDPGYVASGIVQSMAYSLEFPIPEGTLRKHVTVGPAEVVSSPWSDGGMFHLCNQADAAETVRTFADEPFIT